MSILKSTAAWGKEDGRLLEDILSEVTEDAVVPRIEDALGLLVRALNAQPEGVVALDLSDPVLTDVMRCILSHQWLLPSIQRSDSNGKMVASFFMQPFGSGQVLSLFSSVANFDKLVNAASKAGVKLTAVPFAFAQVVMAHLPNMTLEAVRQHGGVESNAVVALSLDPLRLLEEAAEVEGMDPEDNLVLFSEASFGLLQSFCDYHYLAGRLLQTQEDVTENLESITASQWKEVLCNQPLHAIEASKSGDSTGVFGSELGMLLFCYPGDASKTLAHHRRKGTPGLDPAKVTALKPESVMHLVNTQAGENKSVMIAATVLDGQDELQLHGLHIAPDVFFKSIEPEVAQKS